MKKIIITLSIILTVIACEESSHVDNKMLSVALEEEAPIINGYSKASNLANQNIPVERKMIWTGHLAFQVQNVDESTQKITEMVKKAGGFISDLNLTSSTYEISNSIKIRIDNEKFQDLISSLKSESKFIKRIEINSTDVTEEFIDIESRLKTKRDVRDRYIKILNTKTGDVKDIIAAEEAIRKITEEIEAKEGRLRYLKDKVKFSTINLRIYQEVEYTRTPEIYVKTFTEKASQALGNGWEIVKGFVLFILTTWPFWLIIFSIGFWKRKWFISKFGN